MSQADFNSFNPYIILDVDSNASLEEIKQKFRKLTLKYHPDRNRRNRNYKEQVYKDICTAYAMLSDPNSRRNYDTQQGSTQLSMRESSRDFMSQQSKDSRIDYNIDSSNSGNFGAKPKFSEGDLNAFNAQFERMRAPNPNDHGYGDGMASRLKNAKDRESVNVPRFLDSFNEADFNRAFEERSRTNKSTEMIEHSNGEPMAFTLDSQTQFTDIAVFDGYMILGKDTNNYTNVGSNNNLNYVDYMSGFETITGDLPSEHEYLNNKQSVDRMYEERKASLALNPYDEMPESEKKSFNERLKAHEHEQIQQQRRELKENEQIVSKYRNQYSENYLGHKPKQSHSSQNNNGQYSSQAPPRQAAHHNPRMHQQRQQHPQHPYQHPQRNSRTPRQQYNQPQNLQHHSRMQYAQNYSRSTQGHSRQEKQLGSLTRDRVQDSKDINDRLSDRQFLV